MYSDGDLEMSDYRLSIPQRPINIVVRAALRLGIAPRDYHLLSVPGRKSGRVYSTPVYLIQEEGQRWLVAPYGERAWVKNARAAGRVTLSRRGISEEVAIVELSPPESAPVLQRYIVKQPITRKFFQVTPESPIEEFIAEAPRHPVFQLVGPSSP